MKQLKGAGDDGADGLTQIIDLTIKQIAAVLIADIRGRYGLPKDMEKPAKRKLTKTEIKTPHYSVDIVCDYREARFKVALDDVAIKVEREKLRPKGLTWDFLGYVTESSFGIEDIREAKDFRKSASIRLKQSDEVPLGLKVGMPHYAFFVIAFENEDLLQLVSESATMVRLPPAPSFIQIRMMKAELAALLSASKPPEVIADTEAKLDEIYAKCERLIESHMASNKSEAQKEALIEKTMVECGEAVNRLHFFE